MPGAGDYQEKIPDPWGGLLKSGWAPIVGDPAATPSNHDEARRHMHSIPQASTERKEENMASKKGKHYVRPDGLHEAVRTINGKRVAFRGKTDREVDRKILEYQQEAAKGRRFPEVADEWEREHESEIAEGTRKVYSYAVKRLKAAFPQRVAEIEPLDVKRYISAYEKQGHSSASVSVELAVCRMIFSYAVLAGDIRVSPAAEVRKSRGLPCKRREALTEEQEEEIGQMVEHLN